MGEIRESIRWALGSGAPPQDFSTLQPRGRLRDISIVKKEQEKKEGEGGPRVVEVRVEQGVQTVRIELS